MYRLAYSLATVLLFFIGTAEAVTRAIALAKELAQFERPMPVMDDYDLLLADPTGGIQ